MRLTKEELVSKIDSYNRMIKNLEKDDEEYPKTFDLGYWNLQNADKCFFENIDLPDFIGEVLRAEAVNRLNKEVTCLLNELNEILNEENK